LRRVLRRICASDRARTESQDTKKTTHAITIISQRRAMTLLTRETAARTPSTSSAVTVM
jgi:hypothetical protein